MNKGLEGAHPPLAGGLGGVLKGDLLVLVLREIPFPSILVLRRVCRMWDNAINENPRFQRPYTRYRFEEIENEVVSRHNNFAKEVWIKWINLLLVQGLDPSAWSNITIKIATVYGHLSLVKHLLKDLRVRSTINLNLLVLYAEKNGQIQIKEFLINYKLK